MGMNGGGTVQDISTSAQMTAYENIFGPAARDIKFDAQRNKRHQRWHLPDALRGPNVFLTDRIDGLITDATSSPFTKTILPYLYVDQPDKKIKWNVYSFDEGVASRVPYEAAARVLPQSKRTFSGYAVRQGLAIAMEHNFMMSPAGMDNFRKQLQQLVGSIQMTNDLDVHMALLHAPSYQKQVDEKYYDQTLTTSQNCRVYTDLFGFFAKNDNALDFLIEDAKNHLQTWGSKPPTFMLCNRNLTKGLTMNPEKTMYYTNGPDGKQRLTDGPELPSYRGLSFINTRKFSLDAGTAPRDLLRRRVRVSEHHRIPWDNTNVNKRYEFYDQSRDSMFYLSWHQLWTASMPRFEDNAGDLVRFIDGWKTVEEHPETFDAALPGTLEQIVAGFYQTLEAGNGQVAPGLTAYHIWKLGAWLGFWPLISEDQFVRNSCPKFLKDLEVLWYAADESYIHWRLMLDDDADGDKLRQYIGTAVVFIFHTMNKSKHMILNDPELLRIWLGDVNPGDRNHEIGDWQNLQQREPGFTFSAPGYTPNTLPPLPQNAAAVFPSDIFILRPNIEHNMLGIIFGRGGGPEELGATFWGQTELSVYDDTQHGIWGMSYKYHERAIVTNERNLIRVFDIAFDGYCGGGDSRIMRWDAKDTKAFREATGDTTRPYSGPSMIVFALPPHNNSFDSFPNPVVFHPSVQAADTANSIPDRGLKCPDILKHCCFHSSDEQCAWATPAIHAVYKLYYGALDVDGWRSMTSMGGGAGALAVADETAVNLFSFSGQMCVISKNGNREDHQGSGHLGPSFVGVASVREGRGLLQLSRQAVLGKMAT
jgi:hypothetical protein